MKWRRPSRRHRDLQKHKTDPDPEVAAWETKTLPTLQNYLTMALEPQKSVGKH